MHRLKPNGTIPHALEITLLLRGLTSFGALEAASLGTMATERGVRIPERSPSVLEEAETDTGGRHFVFI